jgi:RNA recognition motif-containing protein
LIDPAYARYDSSSAFLLVRLPQLARFQIGKGKATMKNIFVGNLSYGATEEDVRALFEAHGTVDRVSIVTDRDTGQPRGFGFVEMSNNSEADHAIEALNGRDMNGRALNVNEARPKADRGGFGGGGGNRSGRGGGGGFGRKQSRW